MGALDLCDTDSWLLPSMTPPPFGCLNIQRVQMTSQGTRELDVERCPAVCPKVFTCRPSQPTYQPTYLPTNLPAEWICYCTFDYICLTYLLFPPAVCPQALSQYRLDALLAATPVSTSTE